MKTTCNTSFNKLFVSFFCLIQVSVAAETDKDILKKKLTTIQFEVTQKSGTEPPFKNEYWDNKEEGLYLDLIDDTPLFSSKDKFDSGTGWPSFTKPLDSAAISEKEDSGLFTTRTEVRGKKSNSHLGHVFNDGPAPTGLRYCMNSAALRFVPKSKLKEMGLEKYVNDFTKNEHAIFAGGCFWCMEPAFEKLAGVVSVTSGFTGGHKEKPTYKEVSAGGTGHFEAIEVIFDPGVISYDKLLDTYWKQIDPFDPGGQFCDRGDSYKAAIFTNSKNQKDLAEKSKTDLEKTKKNIATEILDAKTFFPAEDYHQNYSVVNPIRYKYYRTSCGRDKRLKEIWGSQTH